MSDLALMTDEELAEDLALIEQLRSIEQQKANLQDAQDSEGGRSIADAGRDFLAKGPLQPFFPPINIPKSNLAPPEATPSEELSVKDLGQSFNTGVVDFINTPSDLINAGIGAVESGNLPPFFSQPIPPGTLPRIDTEGFREQVSNVEIGGTPLTAKPGQEARGFLPRAFRIAGASVGGAAALQAKGTQVLAAGIPAAQRTVIQQAGALTAENPVFSPLMDLGFSASAALGGEIVARETSDPTAIALGEIGFGLAFPVTTAVTRITGKGPLKKVSQAVTPFIKKNKETRLAQGLQDVSADPQGAAGRITDNSNLSVLRQTGDKNLLAAEKFLLQQDPVLEQTFSENLKKAIAELRLEATQFGGQNRSRSVLQNGSEYLIKLTQVRAGIAAQKAQNRIDKLGGDATQRQTSEIARTELNKELKLARQTESEAYNKVDLELEGSFDNAKLTLKSIKDSTSRRVPSEIPAWLTKAINSKAAATQKDIQQVRSKVLELARNAADSGDRLQAGKFNKIADGLLKDLEAIDDPALDAARAISRALNDTYTRGPVGEILGQGQRRGAGLAPQDTLGRVFSGSSQKTNAEAFLKASPSAAPQMQQFLASRFVGKAAADGNFSQPKAQTEINRLQNEGMFEVFPDLRTELDDIVKLFGRADTLSQRATAVANRGGSRIARGEEQSLAGLLLDGNPGTEMRNLLNSKNPTRNAAAMRRRMGNNEAAKQGLKSAYMEELAARSTRTVDGVGEFDGGKMASLFQDNLQTAKALGMTEQEIGTARLIFGKLKLAQADPGAAINALNDETAQAINFLLTLIGARAGAEIAGKSFGAGIKSASAGATLINKTFSKFTTNEQLELALEAIQSPPLMRSLLTRTDAPAAEIEASMRRIESWLAGVVIADERDKFKTKPGSANVGVTEQLNLGNQ